jgi:hypothetical protein
MKLTKEQRNFFAGLDLDKAIAAGEGKVHFEFTHKGCVVEVAVFCSCDADIIVKPKYNAGKASCPATNLCLINIPDTTNVSGPELLRRVHAEAGKAEYSPLKQAWLDTPYVEWWNVSIRWSCTEFSANTGEDEYRIEVTESPDDDSTTVAELFLSGDQIYTFTIPQPYPSYPAVKSLRDLAEAINAAWRDAVLSEYNEEESK